MPENHRARVADRLALSVLRCYQQVLSPLWPARCRFVPSCSAYTAEAVSRFGWWRGSWYGLRRLARCQPLSAGGFDPVMPLSVEE